GYSFVRLVELVLLLDALLLGVLAEEAIGAAAARRCNGLAVEPFDRFLWSFEQRRVRTHHDHVAALTGGESSRCDELNRRLLRLGGRNHGRHIAEVADLLFIGEHGIDDDRALKRALEIDRAARWQVFLP